MRPALPDYYGILGVAHTATPEEIKKRYRELARRYHPDVATVADAAARFKEINEANRILSDATARARYDSELKLARLLKPEGAKERGGEGATKPPKPQPSPNTQGRTPNTAGPTPQRPTPNAQRPTPNAQRPTSQSPPASIIEQAQKAYFRMKYREAEALCRQALRTYGRSAPIYEILGDICRVRGRTDEAVAMYSYALQLDRTNRSVQAKFDKLVGRPSGATMAGSAARAARQPTPSPTRHSSAGSPGRAALNVVGGLLVAALVYIGARMDHAPATNWKVWTWDPLLLFSLGVSAALIGFLMSLNSVVGAAKTELSMAGPRGGRSLPMVLSVLLVAYSVLLFYAGLVYYVLVGSMRQAVSKSVLIAFVLCFALVATVALLEQTSRSALLLFGGNVVFAGFLTGWVAGDQVRR